MKSVNRSIYVYWYGNSSKKEQLINYYKKINKIIYPWKIEVGPSEEEHEYLLKNNKFYKKCFDNEIFAFCSDVWRIYKVYKEGGLYIDAGCTFNESKIKSFLNKLEQYDYCFVLETPYFLLNGIFWFKNKNNNTLLKILNYTNKLAKSNFNHTITGPIYFSHFIFKKFGYLLEQSNENILLLKSKDLDPNKKNNIIYIHPSASWWTKVNTKSEKEFNCKEYWESAYNSFNLDYENNKHLKTKRKIYSSVHIRKLLTYKVIKLPVSWLKKYF